MSISPIHTPCKNCVFAIYTDKTQTDCAIGYLNKYRSITDILEVYDNEKEFYVVNNKKCLGYREDSWFKNEQKSLSTEDKVKIVLESNKIDYVLFVDLKVFTSLDLDNLTKQLSKLTVQPKKIIFVRYQKEQKPEHTFDSIKKVLDASQLKCLWRIQTVVNDDTHYEILNNAVNINKKYRFFCGIKKPSDKIGDVIDLANKRVYQELGGFTVISDEKKDVILFSGGMYRYSSVVHKVNLLKNEENYTLV
jgi:hypothetical protein